MVTRIEEVGHGEGILPSRNSPPQVAGPTTCPIYRQYVHLNFRGNDFAQAHLYRAKLYAKESLGIDLSETVILWIPQRPMNRIRL